MKINITEINRRIVAKGFAPLDEEDLQLMADGQLDKNKAEIDARFDDLRDRVGVNCDDLRPTMKGKLVSELERLGFKRTDQGGGYGNYLYTMPNGLTLTCTDADSPDAPADDSAVVLAITSEAHSETLAQQRYTSGSELAEMLSFQP